MSAQIISTEETLPADLQQEFDRMHEEAIVDDALARDPVCQAIREWVTWIHEQNDLRSGG